MYLFNLAHLISPVEVSGLRNGVAVDFPVLISKIKQLLGVVQQHVGVGAIRALRVIGEEVVKQKKGGRGSEDGGKLGKKD